MIIIWFILHYIIAIIIFAIIWTMLELNINIFLWGFLLLITFYILRIFLKSSQSKQEGKISYPLMEAVIENNEDKIKIIINNINDENILQNAFEKAIEKEKINIIKIFLEHNIKIPSLLYINFKNIDLNILKLLFENGADINEKNWYWETLIHKSIYSWREDIIDLLLKNGIDIDAQNYDHWDTTLTQQAYTGNPHNIWILLKNGADINIQTNNGSTALIKASTNNKPENVKILLENWANPDIIRDDWYTALMLASYKWEKEAVKLLLDYWADKSILTPSWNSAKDLAGQNNQYEIIKLLENY